MSIFKRKKQKFDEKESILADIMAKRFDDLNENLKSLLVDNLADLNNRITDLEAQAEKEIKIVFWR